MRFAVTGPDRVLGGVGSVHGATVASPDHGVFRVGSTGTTSNRRWLAAFVVRIQLM